MARDNVTQTQVRLPNELLEALKVSAERNIRSLNAEIIYQLQAGMGITSPHATPEEVRQIVADALRDEMEKIERRRKDEFLDAVIARAQRDK